MNTVIDDLYFGRINPCDRCSTPKESELMGRISEREMFEYGLRLGMRLAVEIYNTTSVIK